MRYVGIVLIGLTTFLFATGAVRSESDPLADRIRTTLEQMIASDGDYASILESWPSFNADLKEYLARPHASDIDDLVRRSAIHVQVHVEPSTKPGDDARVVSTFDCHAVPLPVLVRAEVQASLNDVEWTSLWAGTCEPGVTHSLVGNGPITQLFAGGELPAGTHCVMTQAKIDYYDLTRFRENPPATIAERDGLVPYLEDHEKDIIASELRPVTLLLFRVPAD